MITKLTPRETVTGLRLKLVGEDGNAFAILSRALGVLKDNGKEELCTEFEKEATSGDYDNLLRTCIKYFMVDVD